jgi:hypothetical protein
MPGSGRMESDEGSNGRRRRLPKNGSVSTLRDSRRVSGQAFGQFRGEVMGLRMEETIVKSKNEMEQKIPIGMEYVMDNFSRGDVGIKNVIFLVGKVLCKVQDMAVEMKEYIRRDVADEVECQDDDVKGHDQ